MCTSSTGSYLNTLCFSVVQLLAFHKADLTQPDDDGLTPEQLGESVGAFHKPIQLCLLP